MFPKKITRDSHIRVVAPSASLAIISPENRRFATTRLEGLGFRVSVGEHVEETGMFKSGTIASRVADIHAAFLDPTVDAVIAVIGGFDSNQLLAHIDYEAIRKHPKIIVGYSDTTALITAIYAKTGLVTYSGPSYSSFAERRGFEYTEEYFKKCLMSDAPFGVDPSPVWSNDQWYLDQEARTFVRNEGPWVINEGECLGTILGGNLGTFNLLLGTSYRPPFNQTILFLEEDGQEDLYLFSRMLQSLIDQPDFSQVRGLVLGRFERKSDVARQQLTEVVASMPKLQELPIIANMDFGHTEPKFTFPLGGTARLRLSTARADVVIETH